MSRHKLTLIALAALAIAIAGAPAAIAQTLSAGSDVWKTEGTGSFVSFVSDPIPAGFFCSGSPAFAGTIEVTGKPLATTPANALRGADTVIVRPQAAAFDANGVAQTTGHVAAMSLKGKSQLTVSCSGGSVTFDILAYADDPSVPTNLQVIRTGTLGGTFSGTVRVPAVLRFTNAADPSHSVELDNDIDFAVPSDAEWTSAPGGDGWASPAATVDTDADGTPDTAIPAASNFFPGKSPNPQPGCANPPCPVKIRHQAPTHAHVVLPPPKPCRVIIVTPNEPNLPAEPTTTEGVREGTTSLTTIDVEAEPAPAPVPCTGTGTTN